MSTRVPGELKTRRSIFPVLPRRARRDTGGASASADAGAAEASIPANSITHASLRAFPSTPSIVVPFPARWAVGYVNCV
jgi:hypothetical protein